MEPTYLREWERGESDSNEGALMASIDKLATQSRDNGLKMACPGTWGYNILCK